MDVYDEIRGERARQDAKWGGPDHDDRHSLDDWCDFIEERTRLLYPANLDDSRATLIEVAALAVAAIESMDRRAATR